jgi:predicted RNase H-related nuclease YkuK (DUF458 family)
MEMKEAVWLTMQGENMSLTEFVNKYCNSADAKIYVGTDSQVKYKKVKFITAVVIVTPEEGGHILRSPLYKDDLPKDKKNKPDLRARLLHEAWLSIQTSLEICELSDSEVVIHLDINANPKFKSGKYKTEIAGFVAGSGFNYEIKPNAFVASCIADKFTK